MDRIESLTLTAKVLLPYKKTAFFETGTYEGGGICEALRCRFDHILSCDTNEQFVKSAIARFKTWNHVRIVLGKSADVLAAELPHLPGPITFWLDAHDDVTQSPTPLVDELSIICSRPQVIHDAILIDDMRILRAGEGWAKDTSVETLVEHMKKIAPGARITYHDNRVAKNDIMAITFDQEQKQHGAKAGQPESERRA
jgi:hypothetical protein